MNAREKDKLIRQNISLNYEKYYRLAFSYAGNEQDALDIVQDAAYKAILHSGKLRDPEKADSWIGRVVINQAFDHFRKRRDSMGLDQAMSVAVWDHQSDLDLEKAMRRLKPEEKRLIRMRYYEDLKISDIAEKLGLNENTVKSRLYRSLAKIKDFYTGG